MKNVVFVQENYVKNANNIIFLHREGNKLTTITLTKEGSKYRKGRPTQTFFTKQCHCQNEYNNILNSGRPLTYREVTHLTII